MTIVWRGVGILVPIAFFASAGIASFWFDDHRFGNLPYVGWSCIGAAIFCLLVGLATLPGKTTDPNTGAVVSKKKHDFFFLPIIVWAIILGGLGAYLLLGTGPSKNNNEHLTYKDMEGMDRAEYRTVNFYNPTKDTLRYVYVDTDIEVTEGWALPGEVKQEELPVGLYKFAVYDQNGKEFFSKKPAAENVSDLSRFAEHKFPDGSTDVLRSIKGTTTDYNDYDQGWLLMDQTYSMLLVDVTGLVKGDDKSEDEIKGIDWQENIYGDYNGNDLIEPYIKGEIQDEMFKMAYVNIIMPNQPLPKEYPDNSYGYMMVVYKTGTKPSNEQIAQQIITAGFEK